MPLWTEHAKTMSMRYITGCSVLPAPAQLYVALFDPTADPANGLIHELSIAGYSRQPIAWSLHADSVRVRNDALIQVSPTVDGQFTGLAVIDTAAGAGSVFWWHDYDLAYSFVGGEAIPIPIGALLIGMTDPS